MLPSTYSGWSQMADYESGVQFIQVNNLRSLLHNKQGCHAILSVECKAYAGY